MALRAWIGNRVFVRVRWTDEGESVRANHCCAQRGLNFWHVAGDTGTAFRVLVVMRVRRQRRFARTVRRLRAVAFEAKFLCGLAQLRVVARAMHVVAIEASHAVAVHHTLYEIVPLHAVLV